MKRIKILAASLLALGITPLVAFAQSTNPDYIFVRAATIINWGIALLVGFATLVFFWGVIQYVISQGDSKKLEEGRRFMLYGIIGLAVIASVWGLVNLILLTVFGGSYQTLISTVPGVPGVPGIGGSAAGQGQNCAQIDSDTGFCVSQSTIDKGIDFVKDAACALTSIGC